MPTNPEVKSPLKSENFNIPPYKAESFNIPADTFDLQKTLAE